MSTMIKNIKQQAVSCLPELLSCEKLPDDKYTEMKYPKFIPLMRFHVNRYKLDGFGHLMIMHTETKMVRILRRKDLKTGSTWKSKCK